MSLEKTFVMIKPDGVKRGIVGEIISRFERAGFKVVAMKLIYVDRDFSKKHYSEHIEKPFYKSLENFLVSGPVLAMVLEGAKAISRVRTMVGATEPNSANPGTIRGDFSHITYDRADSKGGEMPNLIHASDSTESSKKEIALWFSQNEIYDDYLHSNDKFI